jgi:hypothetical protein
MWTDSRETRELAYEVKFLVDAERARCIRDWARSRLEPDPHGSGARQDEYRIASVYFDTANFDVFRRQGSFGRAKYRIRRYGSSDIVFLERKLRTSSLLTKHRTRIPMDDLECLMLDDVPHDWTGRWFHRRLRARGLQPTCHVSYTRTARQITTDVGFARLTLDEHLRADRCAGLDFAGRPATPVLQRHLILELKFRIAMPAVFKHLVEEFRLNPEPVSKYRFGVRTVSAYSGYPLADDPRDAPNPACCARVPFRSDADRVRV